MVRWFVWLLVAPLLLLAEASLWPMPAHYSSGAAQLELAKGFALLCGEGDGYGCSQTLKDALERYTPLVRQTATGSGTAALASCSVLVDVSDDEHLDSTTDEGYSLNITAVGDEDIPSCVVNANSVYGAIHALETLTQVTSVRAGWASGIPTYIEDEPRFTFRSLLIDTSRHFLPAKFILHIIDSMAMNKLNVLHWHIVDSESFPCDSNVYPLLAEKGAWMPGVMYSVTQMKYIVGYARERGVRIMPEWDVPGHGSWGKAYPELMACSSVLDPTQQEVYNFLTKFLLDMGTIFPDEYLFLGGDEVDLTCFNNNPTINQWMKDHNMTAADLQQYFWQQMTKQVLPQLGKTVMIWEENALQITPSNVPLGTIANAYQNKATVKKLVDLGIPSVLSGPWYLDQENPDGCDQYAWQSVWQCMYNEEPFWDDITPEEEALVVGGEVCMWGEGVNQAVFDERVWPRASAVAERLWSPKDTNVDASSRLAEHTCRMNVRGVRAGPIFQNYCSYDAMDL
eukprot:TRINITY_DN2841_c0_g1_i1.p1 TRINITY_DN2841_c0_g1~~TRINITY_DN2841_c0_g1_i1.p1  ORF type:complete len:511 (+),score=124.17 TRINITY_DN2841_c0_g1_i1:37-1569(+)